jgi:hypothetical protein
MRSTDVRVRFAKRSSPARSIECRIVGDSRPSQARRIRYGGIVAFAEIPEVAPDIKQKALKKTGDFRLIGRNVHSFSFGRAPSSLPGSG